MYKYYIEPMRVHGIECYFVCLKHNKKVVATTQTMSREFAVTWAQTTHQKLIRKRK